MATPQQTALFVIPAMVILGWILDKPLALLFDPFESVVRRFRLKNDSSCLTYLNRCSTSPVCAYVKSQLFSSVLIFSLSAHHGLRCRGRQIKLAGRSHPRLYVVYHSIRQTGILTRHSGLYVVIAVSFWFYPGTRSTVEDCPSLTCIA